MKINTIRKILFVLLCCGFMAIVLFEDRNQYVLATVDEESVSAPVLGSDYVTGDQPGSSLTEIHEEKPAPVPTPTPTLPPSYIQYQSKVVVLMYHHIALKEDNEEITITPDRFRKQMQALKDNHYQVISMEDYIHFLMDNKPVPPNAVVITFDDGYESYYNYAYPILKQMNFTATNFIVVSYVDSYYPRLPFLTWKEILEMHRDGFSFYSHTYDLHRKGLNEKKESVPMLANRLYMEKEKRLETEAEYENRVREDLTKAKTIIHEKLDTDFPLLSFPFGAYNQTVIDIARSLGIQYFFTVKDGINGVLTKEILRVNAGTRYVSAERLVAKLNNFKDNKAVAAK